MGSPTPDRDLDLNFDAAEEDLDGNLSPGESPGGDAAGDGASSQDASASATITEAQFRTLERQYQETLAELEAVSSLNRYREEFEKLFGSFRSSFTNEQQLVAIALAGQAKLESTREKLDMAHRRIDDQEATIANYKRELQKALEEVHLAKSEKKEAEEKINALNGEIRRLTTAVDEATDRGNSAESQVEDLKANLANMNVYAQDLVKQLAESNQSNEAVGQELESSNHRCKELDKEIDELNKKLDVQDNCMLEEIETKQRIMQQLEITQKQLQFKSEEHDALQTTLDDKTIELNFIQANTAKMKVTNDALSKELAELRKKLEVALDENSSNEILIKKLKTDVDTSKVREAQNIGELEKVRKELRDITKINQHLKRAEYTAKQNLDKIASQKEKLTAFICDLENKLVKEKASKEELSRERDSLLQERDSLLNSKSHLEAQVQSSQKEKHGRDLAYETLVSDFKKVRKFASDLEEKTSSMDSKQAALQRENEKLKTKLQLIERQTASQTAAAVNWQRQLKYTELDAKSQLREIDRLNKEKLEWAKIAAEHEEAREDLKQRVKLLEHRIQLLSESLGRQEDDLNSAQKTISNTKALLEKKTEESLMLRRNESTLKKSFSRAVSTQKQLEQEMTKMGIQSKHHAKLLELMQRERDALTGHLTQRNDQLMTVMQERHIQEKVLIRSEKDYADKMMEIQTLKRSLEKVSQENATVKAWAQKAMQECQTLMKERKDLIQQSNKVKQLERELSTPLNVHRWRQLGGTDPEKGDLLDQLTKLRRKMMTTDELLQDKIDEIFQLKQELSNANQRASRAEQHIGKLGELTDILNRKTKQIKTLAAEASLNEWKSMDYQKELESLKQEVRALKLWKRRQWNQRSGSAFGVNEATKIAPSRVSSSSSSRRRKVAFSQTNQTKSSIESALVPIQDDTKSVT